MSPRATVDPQAVVAGLDIDVGYLRSVIVRLTGIGSSPLGFHDTGTPEDAAVVDLVAGQMREIGLADVAIEPVEVDAWRFRSACVEVPGADGSSEITYPVISFGGVPPTPPGGINRRVVDVGDGRDRLSGRRNRGTTIRAVAGRRPARCAPPAQLQLTRRLDAVARSVTPKL